MSPKKTILLVEDQALIAMAESAELRKDGYAVLNASTGEKAIETVRNSETTIDLILMDVDLGRGMDGTQAAEEILKTHDIPVLFLSGHTEKDIVAKTEKITSFGYVVKNTGTTVLNASMKMAFKLFEAHRDIKAKDAKLQETTARLLRGEAIANIGNLDFHVDSGRVTASEGTKKICGIGGEEWMLSDFQKLLLPEYLPLVEQAITRLVENGEPYDLEHKIRQVGTGAVLDIHTVAEFDEENGIVFGVIQDVTNRKRLEEAFIRSSEKNRTMIANISDVIAIMSLDGVIRYKSPNIEKWFGWKPEDLIGTDGWATVHPDDLERVQGEFFKLLESDNATKNIDYRYKCKDGSYKLINLTAMNLTNNPEIKGILMNYRDVTTQREAEAKISTERKLLLSIIDNFPDEFFMKDLRGRYVYVNKEKYRRLGAAAAEEVIGKTSHDYFPEERAEAVWKEQREIMLSKTIKKTTEAGIVSRDGTIRWVQHTTVPLLDDRGEPYGLIRISKDITDFELARTELEKERKLLLTIVNNIPYFIYLKDSQGRYLFANNKKVESLGVSSLGEVLGKTVYDFFPAPLADKIVAMCREILGSGNSYRDREEKKIVNGKIEWRLGTEIPLYDENGAPTGLLSIAKDTTAQKQMEESLRESISQKEVLMKELQHRVKNNLSLISSLLSLETSNVSDQKALGVLNDACGRIHSMSTLYERLYLSDDLSNVELKKYIKDLADSFSQTYNIAKKRIKITTKLADLRLDTKRTVPLGLILNELIMNSLKYAYPSDMKGQIRIVLEKAGDSIALRVEDDGIGLPEGFDLDSSESMGMNLIKVLTAQIGGEISFDRKVEKGTAARVTLII